MNCFTRIKLFFGFGLIFFSVYSSSNLEQIFTSIYHNHIWGGGKETVSGSGSTLGQTQNIRKILPELLKELDIKIILDAACGDFNWMSTIDLSCIEQYIGVDIVKDLIESNKLKYQDSTIRFENKNIATDDLPDADLIICRDVFLHLKYEDIFKILKNFKNNHAEYILFSTYADIKENKDRQKVDSAFRPLNLELPPFNFPKPLLLIEDYKLSGKYMGLWKLEDLPASKQFAFKENKDFSATFYKAPDFDQAMIGSEKDKKNYTVLIQPTSKNRWFFDLAKQNYYKYLFNNEYYSEIPKIPKIIHQIWIGGPLPKKYEKWVESWKQHHPDWEHILWTDEKVKDLEMINRQYFEEATTWVERADILRYELLYKIGGLYVDIDFKCFKPFDFLHHVCDFYTGFHILRLIRYGRVANGLIASIPKHPLLEKVVHEIKNNRHHKELMHRTGPDFFTEIIKKMLPTLEGVNIIFPSNYFYPYGELSTPQMLNIKESGKIFIKPETIAAHYYETNWQLIKPKF